MALDAPPVPNTMRPPISHTQRTLFTSEGATLVTPVFGRVRALVATTRGTTSKVQMATVARGKAVAAATASIFNVTLAAQHRRPDADLMRSFGSALPAFG